jgi:hypothetical protein
MELGEKNMNMKSKGLKCTVIIAVLALGFISIGWAQVVSSSKLTPATGQNDLGLIFNSSNILLGLESYQAGIGGKMAWGNLALRGVVGLGFIGASQAFSVDFGLAIENHFLPGAISPYYGAFARVGYNLQPDVLSIIPFSVGAIIGVEVFLFDFLSVFAEYSLAATFTKTDDLITDESTLDWIIDAKMGNNSMIGVVVYFQRDKSKK